MVFRNNQGYFLYFLPIQGDTERVGSLYSIPLEGNISRYTPYGLYFAVYSLGRIWVVLCTVYCIHLSQRAILKELFSNILSFFRNDILWHIKQFAPELSLEMKHRVLKALFHYSSQIYSPFKQTWYSRGCSTNTFVNKLDGVGPVDNRPSNDQLHHFVQFFLKDIYIYIFIFYFIYFLMKNI